jgi:F-type H+-transporting ATPase subunit epsilon
MENANTGEEEFVFVAGGILEVRHGTVTVLADAAMRGKDVDQALAQQAAQQAEDAAKRSRGDIAFTNAQGEFLAMAARVTALNKLRRK